MKVNEMIFSYSRLETFKQCRYKFKLKYIDEIRENKTPIDFFKGSMVHESLEWFHNQYLLTGEQPHEKDTIKHFQKNWIANWEESKNPDLPSIIMIKPDVTPREYFQEGIACIKNFFGDVLPKFPLKHLVAVEKHVLFYVGNYRFQGYIDRVDKNQNLVGVHDWKTGSVKTKAELNNTEQLSGYEIGLREEGLDGDYNQFWHFLKKPKTMQTKRTPKQLEKTRESILKTIEEIKEAEMLDHFPAKVNFLCSWCSYSDDCISYQEYLNEKDQGLGGDYANT